ncbi:MAG: glycosyltransferase family 4 protein [Acidimicrobiales bacterium]
MLVVAHEASRTGAPLQLLSFLEWLAEHHRDDVEIHTVIQADGELTERFERVGDVTVLDRGALRVIPALVEKGLTHLGAPRAARALAAARLRPQLRRLTGFDAVYLNSFTTIEVLPHLPPAPAVISHVHELNFALRAYPQPEMLRLLGSRPTHWVAVCGEVADALVDECGADRSRISVRHPFIDTAEVAAARTARGALRERLGIPADEPIVMGSGTIDWRKAPGLFVQLAGEIGRRSDRPVHFVWVGGTLAGLDWERVRIDVERSGLDNVHFVGSTPEPLPWFADAYVFALTSHEDPFPMVCLEHAAMGHPIVTFRNGGIVELLETAGPDAAAGIVDHLDVGAMADRVLAYLDDTDLAERAGAGLHAAALAGHDREHAAEQLYGEIAAIVHDAP